jgi:glycosyltransferase involved in cell wall biosynthesis
MRKTRVLLLLYTLEAAGAEKVVLTLAGHLDRRRFEPLVCGLRGGRLLEAFRALGVPVVVIGKRRRLDPGALWRLYRLVRRERVDVLHSHNFSANLWGRLVGLLAGVPTLIATEHTVSSVKSPLQRWLDRLLARPTARIIAVSRRVQESHVREEAIPAGRFTVVYNGLPAFGPAPTPDGARAIRSSLRVADGEFAVTTVGRLEPPKGHEVLLRAAPRILAAAPAARFVLVGEGSLGPALRRLADALGVAHAVRFVGVRSDVRSVLAVSDLCLIPSLREGFSVTMLEAMSVGAPIVATDVGGNAEAIVSGESGLVVPPGDPAAIAAAAVTLLLDREAARALGAAARRRFEAHFTLERMIAETERLYGARAVGPA